jgi:hypothetical protein
MTATFHCGDSEGQDEGGILGGFVVRVWRGQKPLGAVFWAYGVLVSAGLSGLFLLTQARDNLAGQQMVILLLAIHTWWILGSIWRSAARANDNYLHGCARAMTLAWGINAVLLLGFLEVDLIGRFLQ